MNLAQFFRRLVCRHVWAFEQRLPSIGGRHAVQARCLFCGKDAFKYEPKIIG